MTTSNFSCRAPNPAKSPCHVLRELMLAIGILKTMIFPETVCLPEGRLNYPTCKWLILSCSFIMSEFWRLVAIFPDGMTYQWQFHGSLIYCISICGHWFIDCLCPCLEWWSRNNQHNAMRLKPPLQFEQRVPFAVRLSPGWFNAVAFHHDLGRSTFTGNS
jgi:hypothetical protein